MSILARLNALSYFNQSSGFVECPNAWQRTCVRGAHFDVDIHMALLMVNKVYVRMTLVGNHFGGVLLNVHSALHTAINQLC